MSETSASTPVRGRPRSAELDQAILAAVLELAGEVGLNSMSMDDLAKRAGVSKTTVYRRWSSKEAVVIEALYSAFEPFDAVDTGSLRGELDRFLSELVDRFENGPINHVLPHLIEAARHDEAIRSALDNYIQYRRRPLMTIFQHAVDRGDLGRNADLEILVDAIIGPFIYRRLVTHDATDHDFVERLLRVVLPAHDNKVKPDE